MSDASNNSPVAAPDRRLVSLDAYRGFIMLTLATSGLYLSRTFANLQKAGRVEAGSWWEKFWEVVTFHTSHPDWNSQFYVIGCSYWDLIQPSFMFMVGVAMPFSYAKRKARGDSQVSMTLHAIIRAIVLILLGAFLATSLKATETNWQFTNVLAQIGLGYVFVFLLLGKSVKVQLTTFVLILVGYWMMFVIVEPPSADQDLSTYKLTADDIGPGIQANFTKHLNVAAQCDRWLLNLFPRSKTFVYHPGGYPTLNFIPSIATMLMGVLAGQVLRSELSHSEKLWRLLLSGCVCMVVAVIASYTVCPIIKKIWTPSWVLFSGAWTLWILAAFYWIVDVRGWKAWTMPLLVFGMNSIAVYLMIQLMKGWTRSRLKIHLGEEWFSGDYAPTTEALGVLVVVWLLCWWLYRQRIFFRI